METRKKVYDFSFDKVRDQVATAFRRRSREGTVADVIAATGLPKFQVESVLPALVSECRGEMAVTESGEILYRFPQGLARPEQSWGRKFAKGLAKALAALFKVWIMVMLVGYFALFVLILVLAIVVSIALSFARRGDDRDDSGQGFLGFYMVTRVVEFFIVLWLYSGDPIERQRKKKRPFHRAVFEFVFGVEESPEQRETAEKKALVNLLRRNQGYVRLDEVIAITGRDRASADGLISRLMLEFDGQPMVSEQGTLYFWFPELLKTVAEETKTLDLPEQNLIPFSHNPSKTTAWIAGLNGFNLVLGTYFLWFGSMGIDQLKNSADSLSLIYQITLAVTATWGNLDLGVANAGLAVVLGVVPVLYSAFFFGIPLLRRWNETKKNFTIQVNNFRRKLVKAVLANPSAIELAKLESDHVGNAPGKPGAERETLKQRILTDFAGNRSVDVVSSEPLILSVPEIQREAQDLAQIRRQAGLSKSQLGKVVFDTAERLE